MIYSFQLKTLTDDELRLLYYLYKKWSKLNVRFIQSLDRNVVVKKLTEIESQLTDEFKPLVSSLIEKLKIENNTLICEE